MFISRVLVRCVQVTALSSAALVSVIPTASAQSFVNGGFESPPIAPGSWAPQPAGWGWNGAYNTGIANGSGSWGTGAHSGDQYAFVESDGIDFPNQQAWMEQTVGGFQIGQQYRVTFWMARRNGNVGANVSNPMLVLLNHTDVIFNPTYAAGPQWTQYSTNVFTATTASNTFTFETIQTFQDSANLFDDISVQPVPEPASLFAVGAGALLLRRKKPRQRVSGS